MKILDNVISFGSKAVSKVNTPTSFVIGGTVLLVGAVVVAHRAGRKVEETIAVNKEQINNLKDIHNAGAYTNDDGEEIEFTEKDYKTELFKSYISFGWDMAKLYVPLAGLTVGSAACYIYGHKKLAKSLAGMTALYLTTDEAFKKYRKNVLAISGEDMDNRYYYGLTDTVLEEYREKKIDEKTGEEVEFGKTKRREVYVNDSDDAIAGLSQYAVWLDDCESIRKASQQYRDMWLGNVESLANGLFKSSKNGILYMSDIYETLGCVHSLDTNKMLMSHETGWVRGHGDDYIRVFVRTIRTFQDNEFGERILVDRIALDFNCPGSVRAQLAA